MTPAKLRKVTLDPSGGSIPVSSLLELSWVGPVVVVESEGSPVEDESSCVVVVGSVLLVDAESLVDPEPVVFGSADVLPGSLVPLALSVACSPMLVGSLQAARPRNEAKT